MSPYNIYGDTVYTCVAFYRIELNRFLFDLDNICSRCDSIRWFAAYINNRLLDPHKGGILSLSRASSDYRQNAYIR